MSLNLQQKKQVVADVSGVLENAQAAILAEYRGLSAEQFKLLRRAARDEDVQIRIVKNTLAKRAVEDTPFSCLDQYFVGPLAFASSEDPVAVAKILSKFQKEFDALEIKVGAMSGDLLSNDDIKRLASLPSREELLAKLMGTMVAPVTKFVQTTNEIPTKFVRAE